MQRWERSLRGHLPSLASCIYVVVRGMAAALPGSRVPRRDARTSLWARGSVMDALHMDFSLSPRTLSCRPGCLVGWHRRLSVIRWGRHMSANSVGRKSRRYSSVKPERVRELYLQNLESRDGSPAGAACEPRRNRVCVAMHQKNGQNGSCISKSHRKRNLGGLYDMCGNRILVVGSGHQLSVFSGPGGDCEHRGPLCSSNPSTWRAGVVVVWVASLGKRNRIRGRNADRENLFHALE